MRWFMLGQRLEAMTWLSQPVRCHCQRPPRPSRTSSGVWTPTSSASATQCRTCGVERPARHFAAAEVETPTALAMAGRGRNRSQKEVTLHLSC